MLTVHNFNKGSTDNLESSCSNRSFDRTKSRNINPMSTMSQYIIEEEERSTLAQSKPLEKMMETMAKTKQNEDGN